MEKFLVVANWKANHLEPRRWFEEFTIHNLQFTNKIDLAIAPSFPLISELRDKFQIVPSGQKFVDTAEFANFKFQICAQDVSAYPVGAYTGEISAKSLSDLGVKYCLVGHSERRKYLGETNAKVEAKMNQSMQNGIIPILCAQNLDEIPENIRNYSPEKYLIMYEPFSAISTEGQYHPESVDKVGAILTDWKNKLGQKCRFLYGGSVNEENVSQYLVPAVSGLVVGHASLEPGTFFAIIDKCQKNLSSR